MESRNPQGVRFPESKVLPSSCAQVFSAGQAQMLPNVGRLDFQGLPIPVDPGFSDPALEHGYGESFFRQIPPRLTTIRLLVSTLPKVEGIVKQRECLSGLAMQCQWLNGYARMGNFYALSQLASALEGLTRALEQHPEHLDEGVMRTTANAAELLNAVSSTSPARVGQAEGARVIVVDEDNSTRMRALAALEQFGLPGVGIAHPDAAIETLRTNSVDVIVVRSGAEEKAVSRICEAIRQLPANTKTPIIVLTSKIDWQTRAVLAISGATDAVGSGLPFQELPLKVLMHFFRGRISERVY